MFLVGLLSTETAGNWWLLFPVNREFKETTMATLLNKGFNE